MYNPKPNRTCSSYRGNDPHQKIRISTPIQEKKPVNQSSTHQNSPWAPIRRRGAWWWGSWINVHSETCLRRRTFGNPQKVPSSAGWPDHWRRMEQKEINSHFQEIRLTSPSWRSRRYQRKKRTLVLNKNLIWTVYRRVHNCRITHKHRRWIHLGQRCLSFYFVEKAKVHDLEQLSHRGCVFVRESSDFLRERFVDCFGL